MATFRGLSLFDSGPHRVRLRLAGRLYLPPLVGDNQLTSTLDADKAELELEQTGRLVSSTEPSLWSLVDAIVAESEGTSVGTVALDGGQSYAGMRMLRFLPGEAVDRGRVFSVGYAIEYRRFN